MSVAKEGTYEELVDNCKEDEYDIVLKASKGDKIALEYIIKKYKNFVKAKAKSYFLVGADKEDIIQEGMIGLYKAVRDFDGTKTNSFKSFAEICITRQIITAIKTMDLVPAPNQTIIIGPSAILGRLFKTTI